MIICDADHDGTEKQKSKIVKLIFFQTKVHSDGKESRFVTAIHQLCHDALRVISPFVRCLFFGKFSLLVKWLIFVKTLTRFRLDMNIFTARYPRDLCVNIFSNVLEALI